MFRNVAILVMTFLFLAGCAGSGGSTDGQGLQAFKGHLSHDPVKPGRRSLHAHTGVEFFLEVSGGKKSGETLWLHPGNVTKDQLIQYDGRKVKITAVYTGGQAPDPMSAYPTNMDGSPINHGEGWLVQSIE